ncbi:MAG: D-cysteine desulfhydrase family protein [Actinomycetota bacterium]|nr:D-cysteine desulfhydrase family protein [Actinomycetota bacterium]
MSSSLAFDRRIDLAHQPTPLEAMDRLGAHLGMDPGHLWVKRDDMTGLAGGGNKARKLEYLCADALQQGCDTLVTGGGAQSNHVRMTAAAANHLGLACTIVLNGEPPDPPSGNVVIDQLLGPEIVWAGRQGELDYFGIEAAIDDACRRLATAGRRPYAMPIGGASTVGALGYARAAVELVAQDPDFDVVVVADGSGGTHAGLVAGLGDHRAVYGVDVGARPNLDETVPPKAADVAALAGLAVPVGDPGPGGYPVAVIDHDRFGGAYGAQTEQTRQAMRLAARSEGLILDPVYTGKAMAGLIAGVASGAISVDARVVFVHTGGLPALFASGYPEWLSHV